MPKRDLNSAQQNKKGCRACLVIGDRLSKAWAQCPIRLKGICCKDCKQLAKCQKPCSLLYPYYSHETKSYDFKNFKCMYFLIGWEALFKRLDTNEVRGIHE